jgi:hypothetical protein
MGGSSRGKRAIPRGKDIPEPGTVPLSVKDLLALGARTVGYYGQLAQV